MLIKKRYELTITIVQTLTSNDAMLKFVLPLRFVLQSWVINLKRMKTLINQHAAFLNLHRNPTLATAKLTAQ